jgi:hypothetical protein
MEYTDYYVARGSLDDVRAEISRRADRAVIVDGLDGGFVPFVAAGAGKDFDEGWDWLLSVFDAEGSAWGFHVIVDGVEVARAVYGDNAEWGIDAADNGLDGELDAAARALGVAAGKLEACLRDDGVEDFCELVGFTHQYMLYPHEDEMPDGIVTMGELA